LGGRIGSCKKNTQGGGRNPLGKNIHVRTGTGREKKLRKKGECQEKKKRWCQKKRAYVQLWGPWNSAKARRKTTQKSKKRRELGGGEGTGVLRGPDWEAHNVKIHRGGEEKIRRKGLKKGVPVHPRGRGGTEMKVMIWKKGWEKKRQKGGGGSQGKRETVRRNPAPGITATNQVSKGG